MFSGLIGGIMKVWSGVKSILDRTPFTVKFYIGFVLF